MESCADLSPPSFQNADLSVPWCNSTWDGVLCWPPIQSNSSLTLPCPTGLEWDATKTVSRTCDQSGRWNPAAPEGFYAICRNDIKIKQKTPFVNRDMTQDVEVPLVAKILEILGFVLAIVLVIFAVARFLYLILRPEDRPPDSRTPMVETAFFESHPDTRVGRLRWLGKRLTEPMRRMATPHTNTRRSTAEHGIIQEPSPNRLSPVVPRASVH